MSKWYTVGFCAHWKKKDMFLHVFVLLMLVGGCWLGLKDPPLLALCMQVSESVSFCEVLWPQYACLSIWESLCVSVCVSGSLVFCWIGIWTPSPSLAAVRKLSKKHFYTNIHTHTHVSHTHYFSVSHSFFAHTHLCCFECFLFLLSISPSLPLSFRFVCLAEWPTAWQHYPSSP